MDGHVSVTPFYLFKRKKFGKLVEASPDIVEICLETEKSFSIFSGSRFPVLF